LTPLVRVLTLSCHERRNASVDPSMATYDGGGAMALTISRRGIRRLAQACAPLMAALAICLAEGPATAMADTPIGALGQTGAATASAQGDHGSLLGEVRRELSAAHTTRYRHTTAVDEQRGEFNYDCSGFLDYALHRVDPAAYNALPVSETRPLAEDFVQAIAAAGPSPTSGPWQQVPTAAQLRPGDVVAWLTPEDSDSDNTGHVMVVLAAPTRNAGRADEWLIPVADSTTSPHAADYRIAGSPTGLGTGTIGVVTDGSGRPVGYYWRGGVSTVLKHTVVALGRIS
jgi:hypothetical protein